MSQLSACLATYSCHIARRQRQSTEQERRQRSRMLARRRCCRSWRATKRSSQSRLLLQQAPRLRRVDKRTVHELCNLRSGNGQLGLRHRHNTVNRFESTEIPTYFRGDGFSSPWRSCFLPGSVSSPCMDMSSSACIQAGHAWIHAATPCSIVTHSSLRLSMCKAIQTDLI